MGKINVLGFDVANLIAAGEVVDRPASVIKELCENSIDAGAKNITVEIRHGGTTYMRVTDDGCGIEADDLPLTVLRHATSKIATAEDLASIGTLGFRGEALAAIASVCKLKITSRTPDRDIGTAMECEGGEIVELYDTGCACGTTVIARELFYNVPARRKFLKKDASESTAVSAVMEKLALGAPDVSVKYIQDGAVRFMTSGNGKLKDTIYAVLGRDVAQRMTLVDRTDPSGVRIYGYIGEPDLVKGTKSSENFFINSRFVKSRTAMAALEQAFSTRIPHSKFPVCVLNILLNPAVVDVNVHPSKLEVKFANEKLIFEAVYYAVLNTLENSQSRPEFKLDPHRERAEDKAAKRSPLQNTPPSPPPSFSGEAPKEPRPSIPKAQPDEKRFYKGAPGITPKNAFVPVEKDGNSNPEKAQLPISLSQSTVEKKREPVEKNIERPVPEVQTKLLQRDEKPPEIMESEPPKPQNKAKDEPIPDFTIIGEAYNCYVIVQLSDRILMIDKHAAHERIIFDELCKRSRGGDRSSQILMYPLKVRVSEGEALALMDFKDQVYALGFAFTYSREEGTLTVSEVPTELGRDKGCDLISELCAVLFDSTGSVEITGARYFEAKLYQASCKAAVKGGRVYAPEHIRWIVEKLLQAPDEKGAVIKTCPHGRPVAFEIKKSSIERQFERLV